LRKQLAEVVEERPAELAARFERYYEVVALHSGYRLEAARGYLEAGFELVAGALLDGGSFDEKTFADASRGLSKEANEARTLTDLFAVYRRVVADMSAAA